MPIYRRGALYWWRRNLPSRPSGVAPITIRLSLRTASARDAAARAAALELEWDGVAAAMAETLRIDPSREDLKRLYGLAFKTELDRIIVKQMATVARADAHAASNRVHAQLFSWIARSPERTIADAMLVDDLIDAGLDPDEAEKVHVTLQMRSGRTRVEAADLADDYDGPDADGRLATSGSIRTTTMPVSHARIDSLCTEIGIRPNPANRAAALRIVAAGYRNACIEASALLGKPIPPERVMSLPAPLMAMLGLDDLANVSTNRKIAPADEPTAPDPVPPPIRPADAATIADLPITALASVVVGAQIAAGSWDQDRRRDVEAAVKLFVAANGDIPFSTMKQHHLAAMVALFPRLPVRYGFASKDAATGQPVQESVQAALVRGDMLRARWERDPVAAEQEKLPLVGLGDVTRKKHLTWIKALVTFAERAGRPVPANLNFASLRKGTAKRPGGGKAKKNDALLAFATNDLRHLFGAPIWSGCRSLWHRFEPGTEVYHDAWYWCPLIITLHGCRSDEACGLALADVDTEAAIPTIHLRDNGLRRVKTAASNRIVPVHPRMIALGFLDYVRAMRALGHVAAFPELRHETLSFDHNFYAKIFEPLRASRFPNGTSRMRGRKDVDVRSIRSRCISHLRDMDCPKDLRQAIVGHEVGDVTSDIYEEDPDPSLLLPWVEKLGDLVPELRVFPLRLRPAEWQKFGAPRGRRGAEV